MPVIAIASIGGGLVVGVVATLVLFAGSRAKPRTGSTQAPPTNTGPGATTVAAGSGAASAAQRRLAELTALATRLPDHYREVVVLRHIEGRKMREVADAMGRSVDSVNKLWARAMIQLRALMKEAE